MTYLTYTSEKTIELGIKDYCLDYFKISFWHLTRC